MATMFYLTYTRPHQSTACTYTNLPHWTNFMHGHTWRQRNPSFSCSKGPGLICPSLLRHRRTIIGAQHQSFSKWRYQHKLTVCKHRQKTQTIVSFTHYRQYL